MATGNDAIDFPELDGSVCASNHPGTVARQGVLRPRDGVKTALKECGVPDENLVESEVPGSFELLWLRASSPSLAPSMLLFRSASSSRCVFRPPCEPRAPRPGSC